MRAELGAQRVIVFDHTVRGPNGAREPVLRVHNDYTVRSAGQRVRDLLPDEAESLLAHRFAIVNVWRPIRRPAIASPLALCDATSFTDDDLVATDLVYHDRRGEISSVRFSPAHRWVYFPAMQPDEVLLIKCHDSATDGRARLSFHTAFEDPTTPVDAPARESIELRTLVFFAGVTNDRRRARSDGAAGRGGRAWRRGAPPLAGAAGGRRGQRRAVHRPAANAHGASTLRALWIAGLPDAEAAELAALARAERVLVNVEDRPALCDFHNVAEVRRGELLLTFPPAARAPASPRVSAHAWPKSSVRNGHNGPRFIRRLRDAWRHEQRSSTEIADLTNAVLRANGWLA